LDDKDDFVKWSIESWKRLWNLPGTQKKWRPEAASPLPLHQPVRFFQDN
jgi:hypothetical protein